MLENLRRLVWKVESLSETANHQSEVTNEAKPLPAIIEENEDASSIHSAKSIQSIQSKRSNKSNQSNQSNQSSKSDQSSQSSQSDKSSQSNRSDQSNQSNNDLAEGETPLEPIIDDDIPNTTVFGDVGEETEAVFYMFPVRHDTPLGEWIMGKFESSKHLCCRVIKFLSVFTPYSIPLDTLAQLYAFIKCLKSGIHQSILPNRRIAKVQQQSMDLLHRIGDATIIDFADPRTSAKLEAQQQVQITEIENKMSTDNKELPSEFPNISNEKLERSKSMGSKFYPRSEKLKKSKSYTFPLRRKQTLESIISEVRSIKDEEAIKGEVEAIEDEVDNDNYIPEDSASSIPSTPTLNQSIASGLSFASSSATRFSSSSFSSVGTSASRSRVPFKRLDPGRRQTIKSFKRGVKSQLRKMIHKHYNKWKKGLQI